MFDRRSTPSWQWVAITTISALGATFVLLITVAGYAYTDTQKKIKELNDGKADVKAFEEMKADMKDVKKMMTRLILAPCPGRVLPEKEGE